MKEAQQKRVHTVNSFIRIKDKTNLWGEKSQKGSIFPREEWLLTVKEHKGAFYKMLKVFFLLIRMIVT